MTGRVHRLALATLVVLAVAACGGQDDETVAVSPDAADVATASCVESYEPAALRRRAFAFDGTVVSVEFRKDAKLAAETGEEGLVPWVTFSVHRWFKGGSAQEVGVWMDPSAATSAAGSVRVEPGVRLLVAGEPRWGGKPLEDAIAWPCGFTQEYTEAAAAEWEAAL
jgi:hypothetical protein